MAKKKRECDTCAWKRAESKDGDGRRTVDCAANSLQLYQPYAEGCKKWRAKA